ncbi:MAG: hypothetical protein RLZ98_2902 [Pseudomonadota bacterium]|jgi:uncharacterized membrane protein
MSVIVAYVSILIVFGIIDAIWLFSMAGLLYRPVLGDILLDNIRIAPAVIFYLLYPVGIVVFAVMPALRDGSMATAIGLGLLFGGLAYATYDLTNYATLKNWTLQLTVIDIAYGAITAALCAIAGYHAARWWTA